MRSGLRGGSGLRSGGDEGVQDQQSTGGSTTATGRRTEVGSVGEPVLTRQQGQGPGGERLASGREALAALAAAICQDGATRTGAHPQAEAVGLVPAPVVRLEGSLAHAYISTRDRSGWFVHAAERGPAAAEAGRAPLQLARHAHTANKVADMRHRSTPDATGQRYVPVTRRVKPGRGLDVGGFAACSTTGRAPAGPACSALGRRGRDYCLPRGGNRRAKHVV